MASSFPRTRTAAAAALALCEDSTFCDTTFIGRSNDESQNDQHQQHRRSPPNIVSFDRRGRDDDARPRYSNGSNRNRRWSIETSSTVSSTSSEQEQQQQEDIGDDGCCTEAETKTEGASMMVILPQRTNRSSGNSQRWREEHPRRHYSADGDNDRAKMAKDRSLRRSANHNGRRSRSHHSGHEESSEDCYYHNHYNPRSGNGKQEQRHHSRSSDPTKPERNGRRRSSYDGSAAADGWTSSSFSSHRGSSRKKKHSSGVVHNGDDNGTIVSGLKIATIRMLRGRDALKMFTLAALALASAQFYYSIHNNSSFVGTTGNRRFLSTSLDLGGGDCLWQPPIYDVPEQMDFHKTLIAGYPSGDKRMVWLQMEALAGWPAKDEWDFAYLGMSNHPFIKANYPHHEGYWGWEDVADQVVLMVPYIRRSMVEYHDVLWDLEFPTTWGHPAIRQELLYMEATPTDSWYDWRDMRILDECHWFGWFIDYWMEGGLLRDIFTHKRINLAHWSELMLRPFGTREQLSYEKWTSRHGVATRDYYDPHCEDNDISEGCEPVEVVSVDRLVDATRGPVETEKIATALLRDSRTGDHVIGQQAWDCIWEEMIVHRKGPKTIYDRPGKGYVASDNEHNFSEEVLKEMLQELNRLITKYSSSEWSSKPTANILVELLMEHVFYLQMEINEVKSGARKLSDKAFLGPKTREKNRRRLKVSGEEEDTAGAAKKQKNGALEEDDDDADDNEDPEKKQMEDNLEQLNKVGQLEFLKKRLSAKRAREKDRPRTKQV